MTQGLFSAASGIRASQLAIDVIANNISNVNTTAFKSATANFENVFSATFSGGSAPTSSLGGTNPVQLGSGTMLGEIAVNHNQGGTQYTGRSSDLMINGEGFFVVQNLNAQAINNRGIYYSRAGNFTLDSIGNLVTSGGNRVMGTSMVNGSSSASTNTINVPMTLKVAKYYDANDKLMTGVLASGEALDTAFAASATVGATTSSNREVNAAELVNFTISNSGAIIASYSNGDKLTVRVNPDATTNKMEMVYMPNEGGLFSAHNSTLADGSVTQLAGADALFTPNAYGGDPMEGMNFQLQSVTITNKNGLSSIANNGYVKGPNAGELFYGIPGSGSRGLLQSGSLESSNVDMAAEFSRLVIAQRALDANSRMIRAESEALQSIIQAI